MAKSGRLSLATGAALAGAAVVVTSAPAVLLSQPPGLTAITQAYALTAASDISGQAMGVVFLVGYGDFIGPDDPYFPGLFNNDLRLSGPLGVAYYVIDTSMQGTVSKNLENYIFELAGRESDPLAAVQAAVRAAAYVAVASNLGVDSVPAKLVKSLVYGVPFDLVGAIVQLSAPIPLVGDITSVYFTGRAEGDPLLYGTGLNGLIAYSGTLLPWLKPLLGPAGQVAPAPVAEGPDAAQSPPGPAARELSVQATPEVPSAGFADVAAATDLPELTVAVPAAAAAVAAPGRAGAEIPAADEPAPITDEPAPITDEHLAITGEPAEASVEPAPITPSQATAETPVLGPDPARDDPTPVTEPDGRTADETPMTPQRTGQRDDTGGAKANGQDPRRGRSG
jgi:hypothetical protein